MDGVLEGIIRGQTHVGGGAGRGGSFQEVGDREECPEGFLFTLRAALAADEGIPQLSPFPSLGSACTPGHVTCLVGSGPAWVLEGMFSMAPKEGCIL